MNAVYYNNTQHVCQAKEIRTPVLRRDGACRSSYTQNLSISSKCEGSKRQLSDKTKSHPNRDGFLFGGEGGIRTLELLLTVTRFPIVRARPATRLLQAVNVALS